MSKTAVVFTASGDQGSSVVKTLLSSGWKVTGIVRKVDSEAAKALEQLGAKMTTGDLNDPESYKAALEGADAAFVNADFWSSFLSNGYNAAKAAETEIIQARNAIQACHDAGIKSIVYSTLDEGFVVHWNSKAQVTKWAKEAGIPITNLLMTFYYSGITRYNMLTAQDDGSFKLGLPGTDDTHVPGIPVEQTGLWVKVAFEEPDQWRGKTMEAATDNKTIGEMAAILSRLSGKKVVTNGMNKEFFESDAFKGMIGQEMWDNWKLFANGEPKRDIPASRALAPEAWDFEQWAQQDPKLKQLLGY